jgi:hypothetical protein
MKCFIVTFTDAAQYKRMVYLNCPKPDHIADTLAVFGCQVLEITDDEHRPIKAARA